MSPSAASVRTFTMSKSLNESLAVTESGQPQHAFDSPRSLGEKSSQTSNQPVNKHGITFAAQDKLPKLPIPDLDSTLAKYLHALKPLQSRRDHAETQQAVDAFLKAEGPELQERLKKYANGKTSYIEQFCMCSYSL
jgi:carnitine O-acetyltransferase